MSSGESQVQLQQKGDLIGYALTFLKEEIDSKMENRRVHLIHFRYALFCKFFGLV